MSSVLWQAHLSICLFFAALVPETDSQEGGLPTLHYYERRKNVMQEGKGRENRGMLGEIERECSQNILQVVSLMKCGQKWAGVVLSSEGSVSKQD